MEENKTPNILYWDRTMKPGVSKLETYQGLGKVLDEGLKQCSKDVCIHIPSKVLPVFTFIEDFERDFLIDVNGTYKCGYYKDIPIYVSPWTEPNSPISLLSIEGCVDIVVTEEG